jgi:hypothetical protein
MEWYADQRRSSDGFPDDEEASLSRTPFTAFLTADALAGTVL